MFGSESVHRLNLRKLLAESKRLRDAYTAMDAKKDDNNETAGKFSVIKANSGSVDDFFRGLGRRVGAPNSKFKQGMELEHCSKYGCDIEFTTSNYKITTTPKLEWNITVNHHPCPEENIVHGRKIRKLSEVMEVSLVLKAKLIEEEVISIVLYTGPMVFARILQLLFVL